MYTADSAGVRPWINLGDVVVVVGTRVVPIGRVVVVVVVVVAEVVDVVDVVDMTIDVVVDVQTYCA